MRGGICFYTKLQFSEFSQAHCLWRALATLVVKY